MATNLIHIRRATGGNLCLQQGPGVTIKWRKKVTCPRCEEIYAKAQLDALTREAQRRKLGY